MGDVEQWIEQLRAEGRAPGTVQLKAYYLNRLAAVVAPLTATTDDLVQWLAAQDWKPETRKSARCALRDFYSWLVVTGRRPDNPALALRPIRVPPGKPKPTPEAVLEAALDRADPVDRLMVLLAAYAGLRRAEIASLRVADVIESGLRITGKGGRVRLLPLHPRLEHALRSRCADLGDGWLFPSTARPGWHVQPDYVYRHIQALIGTGPHALRHRFGTAVYRASGHDLRATQELLGHSSIATTQRYVEVGEDSMRAAVLAVA